MASPWLLPSLLVFPLLLFFFLKKKLQAKNLPPGPPGIPLVGNLHQLGALPHQSLWRFSQKYGPVMFIKLGRVPTLIISSSEAAKDLFKNHDLNTCSRPRLTGSGKLSYNYLDIAFTPYGDYWRDMRKLCVLELFSAKRVHSFQFIREEEVSLLIDSISTSSSSSVPVDLSKKILALTCNVTCRAAFGKSFQERGFGHERFQQVIHEGLGMLGSFFTTDFFPYVGWIVDRVSGLHARLQRNFHEFDTFYEKIIQDHIQRRSKGDQQEQEDIIDVLLELERSQTKDSAGSFHFSKDHIKAILMNIFLAGVDTGAIVLEWTMAELVRNPRVMRKAQEEIRNYIKDKRSKVTANDIENFGYLKMVLRESLRLHPPSPLLIPRETVSKFNINGYEIYPKTRIQVNVWAIGKDPKAWKNPEEFFPERFTDSSPVDFKGMNSEILQFGGGRRGCPGISMGMATVELVLANLLYHFDWKLPNNMKMEDMNMEEAFGLTIYKKEPLLLVPVKCQETSGY